MLAALTRVHCQHPRHGLHLRSTPLAYAHSPTMLTARTRPRCPHPRQSPAPTLVPARICPLPAHPHQPGATSSRTLANVHSLPTLRMRSSPVAYPHSPARTTSTARSRMPAACMYLSCMPTPRTPMPLTPVV
ncbi:hypothetical protein K438DRAFT_1980595 [Mycena galopus ATCC 62051]|nr:hypothetical protein K438DRAFT_1980595 [Mycena galopus ATCC 62051]